MRRLLLLTFVAPLLAAVACNDATAPPSAANPQIQAPRYTLVIPSTTPQVAAGRVHTCGLKTDGTIVCWGFAGFGGLAVPPDLTGVAQLSAGGFHTCALKTNGTVVCWGPPIGSDWDHGQSTVPDLTSVAQVTAGGNHSCALSTLGTVTCWGSDDRGQTDVPVDLPSVVQVSGGAVHTCALTTVGAVVCWGSDDQGQTDVPVGLTSVAQVSAGYVHTCALKTDGTVVCWGGNDFNGSLYDVGQADVPATLTSVAQVSAGGAASCALLGKSKDKTKDKVAGTVVCWGDATGEYGIPTIPADLAPVAQMSITNLHVCALKKDGTVVCWGGNDYGQLAVPAGLNLKL